MTKAKVYIAIGEALLAICTGVVLKDSPYWDWVLMILALLLCAVIVLTYLWPLSLKYISLQSAAEKLRNVKLRQGNTYCEAVDQMPEYYDKLSSMQFYAEYVLGDNPVWGRRLNSKVWEKIEERKGRNNLFVARDGKSLQKDEQIIYPEAKMLKSDFKRYIKLVKNDCAFKQGH